MERRERGGRHEGEAECLCSNTIRRKETVNKKAYRFFTLNTQTLESHHFCLKALVSLLPPLCFQTETQNTEKRKISFYVLSSKASTCSRPLNHSQAPLSKLRMQQ